MTTAVETVSVAAVLRGARELLAERGRWTKRALARDCFGDPVNPVADAARCWCLEGAIMRADADAHVDVDVPGPSLLLPAMKLLATGAGRVKLGGVPALFNDQATTTHADVLRVLDAAIALAEAA